MAEIVPEIERTAKLVQEIAAASMEQNTGADQVNNAIQQLNQVIQQNAAASEEMASSSEELSSQSELMKDAVSYFNIEVEKRFGKVKNNKMKKSIVTSQNVVEEKHDLKNKKAKGVDFKMGETSDADFQRF